MIFLRIKLLHVILNKIDKFETDVFRAEFGESNLLLG